MSKGYVNADWVSVASTDWNTLFTTNKGGIIVDVSSRGPQLINLYRESDPENFSKYVTLTGQLEGPNGLFTLPTAGYSGFLAISKASVKTEDQLKGILPFLGIEGSEWVGWAYFEDFFTTPDFPRLLVNTLVLAALKMLVAFPITIVVALLLNEVRLSILKRTVKTLIYIPHFLSWTVTVSLTALLFAVGSGALTTLFDSLGADTANYLADPGWFRWLILLQWIWKDTGWGTIIFLAALAGVDQEQYEAAIIDGAGRWSRV